MYNVPTMTPEVFYWTDLAIALSIPILFITLRMSRKISAFSWRMFWIGCGIGALWEIPFYFIGPYYSDTPLYILETPPPYPLFLLHAVHCFWDGGLLMIGVLLVYRFSRWPHFTRFQFSELLILLVWGGLQELAVELASTGSSAWVFVPHWWNPAMFQFQGHDITLLPQLIWVAAPILFYLIALRVRRSIGDPL